jgi:lipoate---protein ligase
MLCIFLENSDPYFCLAAEEYLLKNYSEDIFMLWQSFDTVVVGKHQNTMGEINYRHVREKGIKVARRISGGGTVFHDKGNVNFTFIKNVSGPQEISFKRFTQPITDALATMGIIAVTSGRNDLMVDNRKISGNAEHVYKNRVLHHGTLLYNSDLKNLGNAIRVVQGKYTSKAVQSNRSIVVNISEFLENPPSVEDFIRMTLRYQLDSSDENRPFKIPEPEEEIIRKLSSEKFATWEWQFAYSPAYRFLNEGIWKDKSLNLQFEAEKGKITDLTLEGDAYSENDKNLLKQQIPGVYHNYEPIARLHDQLGIEYDEDLIYMWF